MHADIKQLDRKLGKARSWLLERAGWFSYVFMGIIAWHMTHSKVVGVTRDSMKSRAWLCGRLQVYRK